MNWVQKSENSRWQMADGRSGRLLATFCLLSSIFVRAETESPKAAPNPFESQVQTTAESQIDKLVFAQLKRSNLQPANPCSDAVFVRRAYVDIIGTLPSGHEAREFLLDQKPDKRRTLIDRLLERE